MATLPRFGFNYKTHLKHNPHGNIVSALGTDNNYKPTEYCLYISLDGKEEIFEIYKGKNYIPGSTDRSWSKSYNGFHNIPLELKPIAGILYRAHKKYNWPVKK